MSIIEKAVGKLDTRTKNPSENEDRFRSIRNYQNSARRKKTRSTLELVDDGSTVIKIDFDRLDKYGLFFYKENTKQYEDELRRIKRIMSKISFNTSQSRSSLPSNVFLITSALPNEGKSYISSNLAMSLARERSAGVVLVDADLPRRRLSQGFGVQQQPGLIDILSRKEEVSITDVVLNTSVPHLALISAGQDSQSDPEVFTDYFAEGFFHDLANRFPDRIILIDTPPLLLTSHAASLAQFVGQILVVVEAGVTENRYINDAVELLDKNKTIGFIMNKSTGKRISKHYKEYGEYGSSRDNGK